MTETTPSSLLREARVKLDQGALAEALDRLLRAWWRGRCAEVAEVIELVGRQLDRGLPAIDGRSAELAESWLAIAMTGQPADLGRLLAQLRRGTVPVAVLRRWLQVLERFQPDPRLPEPLLDLFEAYSYRGANPMRNRVLKLVAYAGDGRCLPHLERIEARLEQLPPGDWLAADFLPKLRRLRASITPPPPVSAADLSVLDALRTIAARLLEGPRPGDALGAPRAASGELGEALLRAILADPDADPPRLVFADWLAERGDPRGELIQLQYRRRERASKPGRRERELLRLYQQDWLGPLAAVVRHPGFERGFLSRCQVKMGSRQRSLIGHPLWATVEEITCGEGELLRHPVMRALRVVAGARAASVAKWSQVDRSVPLEELRAMWIHDGPGDGLDGLAYWSQIARLGSLRCLRRLALVEGQLPDYDWLTDSPLGIQLEELSLRLRHWEAGPSSMLPMQRWPGRLEAMPALRRLLLDGYLEGLHFLLALLPGKEPSLQLRLTREGDLPEQAVERFVDAVFGGFPVAALPELSLAMKLPAPFEERFLRRLEGAFARVRQTLLN